MKKLLQLIVLGLSLQTFAQVGIGTTNPSPSSILDITSNSQGVLIPRVTLTSTTDITTITNGNVSGLLVYNTQTINDVSPGFYYWQTNMWFRLQNSPSPSNSWSLTGNSGTDSSMNFLGTTDNEALLFKTNNQTNGMISADGSSFAFGRLAGYDVLSSSPDAIFLGDISGNGSSNLSDVIFLGSASGYNVQNIGHSVLIGSSSGANSSMVSSSNFIGEYAGEGSSDVVFSNFIGHEAGKDSSNGTPFAVESLNFIGLRSGKGSSGGFRSSFIGDYSGESATNHRYLLAFGSEAGRFSQNSIQSSFIGYGAGLFSQNSNDTNFIGREAGKNTTNTTLSNMIGVGAGLDSSNCNSVNYIGAFAGFQTSSELSNAIGNQSGALSNDISNSNFLGTNSGMFTTNATYSIFIGSGTGEFDNVSKASLIDPYDSSILIGNKSHTGGFSKSIALGAGSTNTAENEFVVGSILSPINTMSIEGTGALKVPVGDSSTQPTTPQFGQIRYNTDIGRFEGYVNDLDGNGIQGDNGWRTF